MYKVKLIKGLSYTGAVHATKDNPYVDVESKEAADAAVATGYFELVEATADDNTADDNTDGENNDNSGATDLDKMTVPQLKAYAAEKGIDLEGASRKDDIIAKIAAAATADDNTDGEDDGAADYGEDN